MSFSRVFRVAFIRRLTRPDSKVASIQVKRLLAEFEKTFASDNPVVRLRQQNTASAQTVTTKILCIAPLSEDKRHTNMTWKTCWPNALNPNKRSTAFA